jgi:hypothetical protein
MNAKAVYIFPSDLFDPNKVDKSLNGLSSEDILFMALTLYQNILENLAGKERIFDVYCIWDENKKDILSEELKKENYKFIYTDLSNKKLIFENLSGKEFLSHKNNLIVISDVIDLRPSDYDQCFNLLNTENESLVIAKNKEGFISAFGFNKYSLEIFNSLISNNFNYNDFLSEIQSCEHFMHILNDVLMVRNLNQFKQLYLELSQKKSMAYCSQSKHERFTHLFVEYKDLLK